MNYQVEIIKQIDKLKEYDEFKDLIKEFEDVLSKNQITHEEYNKKYNELNNKFPIEMNIIYSRDTIAKQKGKGRKAVSYKDLLIDILISITIIKYCEKIGKSYTMENINNYDFILNVLNNKR